MEVIMFKIGIWITCVFLFCYIAQYLEKERNKRLTLIIKLVRRFMPRLIAHDLVGVQPMTGNVNDIFKLKYVYSDPIQVDLFPIEPWQQLLIDDKLYKSKKNENFIKSINECDVDPSQLPLF